MIETPSKLRIEKNSLVMKSYEKTTAHITANDETEHTLLLRFGTRQEVTAVLDFEGIIPVLLLCLLVCLCF